MCKSINLIFKFFFLCLEKSERNSLEEEGEASSTHEILGGTKSRNKKNCWIISEQTKNYSASTSPSSVKVNRNNNVFVLKSGRKRKVTQAFDIPTDVNCRIQNGERGNFI